MTAGASVTGGRRWAVLAAAALAVTWPGGPGLARAAAPAVATAGDYLPAPAAASEVTVARDGEAEVTVVTQALADKETGPGETVARFGEVCVFSPSTFALRRDEPTRIDFWNLQADDEHDFMLVDSALNVLMKVTLPPLTKTSRPRAPLTVSRSSRRA